MTPTQIPKGDGDRALPSLLKLAFINRLQCLSRECSLVLVIWDPKAYNMQRK